MTGAEDAMTSESIDTIDALLARYVAGSLPLPARVLVASHLEIRQASRDFVAGLESMAGLELEDVAEVPLSSREDRLARIFASAPPVTKPAATPAGGGLFPRALRDFVGFDADRVPWRTKMPGFREYDVGDVDGCHVSLFWIKPGRKIPAHTHEGSEISLVLDGAFSDKNGRYGRGDISLADDTVDHRPIAEKDRPCIGMAVTDAPLRLTGPFHQRLSDILGA
jgi:putative transcriptional regulator